MVWCQLSTIVIDAGRLGVAGDGRSKVLVAPKCWSPRSKSAMDGELFMLEQEFDVSNYWEVILGIFSLGSEYLFRRRCSMTASIGIFQLYLELGAKPPKCLKS